MEKEMRFHLEEHIDMLVAEGMPYEQARKTALREFGNVEALKEECRDSWGIRLLESIVRHLGFTLRQMRKTKGATLVVIVTLALGIGVNTAIFSLANSYLFNPFDFPDSNQLVVLDEKTDQLNSMSISYQDFLDWEDMQSSFAAMGVRKDEGFNLAGTDGLNRIGGSIVSHGFLKALQVTPVMGRIFTEEDDQPGGQPVVIITEPFWRHHYAADPSILGQSIRLTDKLYTVIGVIPSLSPLDINQVFTPLAPVAGQFGMQNRGNHSLSGLARMKPDVGLSQARSDLETIALHLASEYPNTNSNVGVQVGPLRFDSKETRNSIATLLGAAGFLLLIACANVANIQLVNSSRRSHEFGVRTSLGASRGQIVGQLAVESLFLGILGGLVGIGVAHLSIEWLEGMLGSQVNGMERVGIDSTVLAFCVVASCVSSFLFGLAPLRQVLKTCRADAMKADLRSGGSREGKRWNTTLIIGQFALTCVLLVGAGLLIRTTTNIYQSDPGFDVEQRLTCLWSLPRAEYSDRQKRIQTAVEAEHAINQIPGVNQAAVAYPLPLSMSSSGNTYYAEGTPLPGTGRGRTTESIAVSDTYFQTMGIQLIAGRTFNEFDTDDHQRVAIVDTKFVQQNFLNEDPIGKRITYGSKPPSDPKNWMTIVGVVEHVYIRGVTQNLREQMYRPIRQSPPIRLGFILKTESAPSALAPTIRRTLTELNPKLAVQSLETMETYLKRSMIRERTFMQLMTSLATIGLILAAVGLFGVMSFSVSQQTREIGIRMAIGANQKFIRNQVLRYGALLAGIGLTTGLLLSLGLARLLQGVLYGVSSFDWVSFGSVVAILAIVGLIACWLPAYRATRIAPTIALRAQ